MSKWVVDIHGEIEGDYEIIKEYEEPKTGRWILQPSNKEQGERDFIWWKCSKCGHVIYSETEKDRREFHAFCGRCGAKMIEPQESEMSDMQMVIDIPKEMYEAVKTGKFLSDYHKYDFCKYIDEGIPIPKGHGPLKDSNEIIKAIEYEHNRNDRPFRMSEKYVIEHNVPTIVEADTESEE